jgi:hypothetical protein
MEFSLTDKKFRYVDAMNKFVKLKDYDRDVGIEIDNEGNILLATKPTGILVYDPKAERVRQLFSDPALQQDIGRANLHIYCDRDGILWTSYWLQRGVYELLPFSPPVKRYLANPKEKGSLSNSSISAIVPGLNGEMWIGTGDGLNIFNPDNEKFEVLREKNLPGIKGKEILPLYIDTNRKKAWLSVWPPDNVNCKNDVFEMDIKTRKCRPVVFMDGPKQIDPLIIFPFFCFPYKNGLLVCYEYYGFFEVKEGSLIADLVIPFKNGVGRMVVEDDRFLFVRNSDRNGSLPPNFTFENRNGKWMKIPHPLDSLEWGAVFYDKRIKRTGLVSKMG